MKWRISATVHIVLPCAFFLPLTTEQSAIRSHGYRLKLNAQVACVINVDNVDYHRFSMSTFGRFDFSQAAEPKVSCTFCNWYRLSATVLLSLQTAIPHAVTYYVTMSRVKSSVMNGAGNRVNDLHSRQSHSVNNVCMLITCHVYTQQQQTVHELKFVSLVFCRRRLSLLSNGKSNTVPD